MPFNGAGTFQPLASPTYPAVPGTTITAAKFNAVMQDIFTGLSTCIAKDGQSSTTQKIPFAAGIKTNTIEPVSGNSIDLITPAGTWKLNGLRMQADFSNTTRALRASFQSSTLNGVTGLQVLPNGTSTVATIMAGNSSDPDNATYLGVGANSTEAVITGFSIGSGAALPIRLYNQGYVALEVDAVGVVSTPKSVFGIGTALGANTGYSTASPSGAVEFGTGTNLAFADFHCSTTWQDYNARITCTGASAGVGGGILTHTAAEHRFSAPGGVDPKIRLDAGGATRLTLSSSSDYIWSLYPIYGTSAIYGSGSGASATLNVSIDDGGGNAGTNTTAAAFSPVKDNRTTCGDASHRWSVVYAVSGTINTSDATHKTKVRGFTSNEIAAACDFAEKIGFFKWLSAIAEKGADKAREHCGMTVQEAIAIMESHGLEPFNYAFICFDEWPDQWQDVQTNKGEKIRGMRPVNIPKTELKPVRVERISVVNGKEAIAITVEEREIPVMKELPVFDENGLPVLSKDTDDKLYQVTKLVPEYTEILEAYEEDAEPVFEKQLITPAGSRYSFRPDQLDRFIARGMAERQKQLEARITALENSSCR